MRRILLLSSVLLAACGSSGQQTPNPDSGADTGGTLDDVGTADAVAIGDAPSTCSVAERAPISFEKKLLDGVYRAEGVGAFDVNADGRPDIVTDQFWYDGKTLAPHEIRTPVAYDAATQFALGFGAYPIDANGDGCVDVIAPPHPTDPLYWYENPCGGAMGAWKQHLIAGPGIVGLETPFLVDLFADGHPVLLSSDSRPEQLVLGFLAPPASPDGEWPLAAISRQKFPGAAGYTHGIGVGDIDGDHDLDVLTSFGWFENTGDRAKWIEHLSPNPFPDAANACSRMWTYDVNCDGLADVFCSRPHESGIYWFEQKREGTESSFVAHLIDNSVTQMHALRLADLDGDGIPEVVSGTRWCAHCGAGAPMDPATPFVVYYSLRRGDGLVSFDRHVVDEASGVGAAFDIADIDGDGKQDIVTANKHGLFFFRQK